MWMWLLACTEPGSTPTLTEKPSESEPDSTGTDSSSTDSSSTDSAGTDSSSTDSGGTGVVWGPTQGTLSGSFSLGGEAQGTTRLGAITLGQNMAALSLLGVPHGGVAWFDHDWADAGYHLYDLLSVAEDGSGLAVTYLYAQGDQVPYAYTESYGLPMDWEYASGSLDGVSGEVSYEVRLPALRALPPPMDAGFEISGDLTLSSDGGSVTLNGVPRSVHPLGLVDCSDCPGGPWYEVHLVLAADDACFTILYLFPDEPARAQLEYGLCLPTLERVSTSLDVVWSGSPNARHGPPPQAPVRGVPPPRAASPKPLTRPARE